MCEVHGTVAVGKALTDQPGPIKSHIEWFDKAYQATSNAFERDLVRLLRKTHKEVVRRFAALSAIELRLSKAVSQSDIPNIIPGWFYDELTTVGQAHIALAMARGARVEMKRSAKQRAKVKKFTALPTSAKDIPGFLAVPQDVALKINATVKDTFSRSYWMKHAQAQRKFIEKAIKEHAKQGWTPDETAKYIMADSGGNFGRTAARRIVRTETTGAINGGQHLARTVDITDGLIDGEEWISTLDRNLRPTHHAAHGQESVMQGGQWVTRKGANVLQTGKRGFVVGGSFARFPGDPNLPAGERINCRCTTVPVVDLSSDVPVADPIGLKTPAGIPDPPKAPPVPKKPAVSANTVEVVEVDDAAARIGAGSVEEVVPTPPPAPPQPVLTATEELFKPLKEATDDSVYSHLPFDASDQLLDIKTASDIYAKDLVETLGDTIGHTHKTMLEAAIESEDDVVWTMLAKGELKAVAVMRKNVKSASLQVTQFHAAKDFDVPVQSLIADMWWTAERRGFKRLVFFKGEHLTKQYNANVLGNSGMKFIGNKFRVKSSELDGLVESLKDTPEMTAANLQSGMYNPPPFAEADDWQALAGSKVKVPEPVSTPSPRATATTIKPKGKPKRPDAPSRDKAEVLADAYVDHSGSSGFPATLEDIKQVKRLGGSTGAQLVEDATGARFVLKDGASVGHLLDEYVAEEAYRGVGIAVPDSRLFKDADGKVWKLSKFVDGKELGSLSGEALEEASRRIRDDFAGDALMSNWDTIGLSKDNVLIDKTGKPWRIDVGGSLRYRAQGGDKGDAFKQTVGEFWSMSEEGNSAAPVFGKKVMSFQDKHESARKLLSNVDTVAKRERWLATFKDTQLRFQMQRRLESLEDIVETTEDFVADSFQWEYVDDVQRHRVALQERELGALYDQELTRNYDTSFNDADGNLWDSLRSGEGNASKELSQYLDDVTPGGSKLMANWADDQAGSSWSHQSVVFKHLIAEARGVDPEKAYYWAGGASGYENTRATFEYALSRGGAKREELEQVLRATHANTFEMLRRMRFEKNDVAGKAVKVMRTHNSAVLKKAYGVNTRAGTTGQVWKEGVAESTSLVEPVYIGGSNLLVEYTVPHTRVINTYFLHRPGTNRAMFFGDVENEFLTVLEGVETRIVGRR